VPHWTRPIVIGRHAHGDIYRAVGTKIPGPGTVTLSCQAADGSPVQSMEVQNFGESGGVAMAMHKTRVSIVRRDAGGGVRRDYGVRPYDPLFVGAHRPERAVDMNTQAFLAKLDENLQKAMK
jgi:hypothetical protein